MANNIGEKCYPGGGSLTSMAMNIAMPANLMVLAFVVGMAAIHWRRSHMPPPKP